MDEAGWRDRIKACCESAGTYRDFFDPVIATLAGILERRDHADAQYKASGGNPVIAYTNKGGATNLIVNPALQAVTKLETDALAYWRDLGLTPAGLKRINEEAVKGKKAGRDLDDLLKEIGI